MLIWVYVKPCGTLRRLLMADDRSYPSAAEAAAIVGAVVATAAAGTAASAPAVSSGWYRRLKKPSWQPPGAAFGPVWTILYGCVALSMLDVRRGHRADASGPGPIFVLYGSNLVLNAAWTWLFFRFRLLRAAGLEIVVLEATTVALIVRLRRRAPRAALLLVPYALWVAFAAALNWAIAARNRG